MKVLVLGGAGMLGHKMVQAFVLPGEDVHCTLAGVYQVSSGRIAKYDLLHHMKAAYSLPITIERDDVPECDRSLRGDALKGAIGCWTPPPEYLESSVAETVCRIVTGFRAPDAAELEWPSGFRP